MKILESESRAAKTEFETSKKTFFEKSETDDKYIRALRAELTRAKEEIERLKNAPPETVTRVVYRSPEELGESKRQASMLNFSQDDGDELTKVGKCDQLRREAGVKDFEIGKKDRIIAELMDEKMSLERQLAFAGHRSPEERDVDRLKSLIESLKLEKEELLRATAGGTKTDSYQIIKDLSDQNAKLRMKLLLATSKT